MARYPNVGSVKTRLGESLGHEEATNLYLCFLKDIIEKVNRLSVPFFIYFTPKNKMEDFELLLGNNLTYVPQIGDDLNQILYNGFRTSLKMGYNSSIALASDIPDLPESILNEAVLKLKTFDSVIGPSIDGGYYLIGLQKNAVRKNLFQGITWSTEKVYAETMNKIKEEKISCYPLTPWGDVDVIDDLERLLSSKDSMFHRSHSWKYLKGVKLT